MSIRKTMDKLFSEKKEIQRKVEQIQNACPHKTSVYKANGSSGNWDNDSYYWFDFYCYDCQKRWSHDQSLGHGHSLKVDKIDYNKNPEIVEILTELL